MSYKDYAHSGPNNDVNHYEGYYYGDSGERKTLDIWDAAMVICGFCGELRE